jgi:DNA segregation ATPase FtsK/SpoIIIE, S-DNA-T family
MSTAATNVTNPTGATNVTDPTGATPDASPGAPLRAPGEGPSSHPGPQGRAQAPGQRRRFGRVEFNRPPRLRAVPRVRRVDLPPPPTPPSSQSGSMMGMLIIPLIASTATSGVFILFALTAGGAQQTLMLIAAVVMVAGTGLPVAWMYFEDRGRVKRERRLQLTEYRRRLRNRESDLLQLRAEEQAIREEHDPDAATLLDRARARHRQLWERRPTDDDFLTLRLGLGLARSEVEVSFPGETSHPPPYAAEGGPLASAVPASPVPASPVPASPPTSLPSDAPADIVQEALQLAEAFAVVPDVPIVAGLRQAVAIGLTGEAGRTVPLARAMLCQAAVHHSPDEVVVVGFLSRASLADWAWLKWLPHTRPQRTSESALTLLAWDEEGRERLARWLLNELANRRRAVTEASSVEQAPSFPWLLVFTDDFPAVRAEAAFQLALNEGARLNIALLGLAPTLGALPRGCGAVTAFESRPGGLPGGLLTYTDTGPRPAPIQCVADAVDVQTAEDIARALAGVTVVQDAGRAAGDLPERVSFFDALGIPTIESEEVAARWADASTETLLQIPLGQVAEGKLLRLDFKEQALGGQGPHGLVAGTTGAGKSELLLTIIAGLALRHPPDVLNFVLIDYKGGDAFRAVVDLPHTVALITDLDEHLASRALVFLTSELKQRERRIGDLKAEGVTSVAEYQAHRGQRSMPLLVIVVDEFARLKAELPEFVRGLVDVARVGRSLGVHLILATQTPSGSVDEEIKKNSNFGICLRVRDPSDSRDVIGEPDAFLLPGSLPGRAYFRAGLEPVQLFQTARVGARYRPRDADEPVTLAPFPPAPPGLPAGPGEAGAYLLPDDERGQATEVDVLVRHLGRVAAGLGVQARRWPEPLPDEITLLPGPGAGRLAGQRAVPGGPQTAVVPVPADVPDTSWTWPPAPPEGWLVGPIGLVDEPQHQRQDPFLLDASRNAIVYGGAGSGKSTLLHTLATSLALTHSPQDLHLFAVDFGSRALRPLRALPHCGPGGLFFATETDRVRRLFRYLLGQVARRREAGIVNLRQQRAVAERGGIGTEFPFILVLLDNYAGFRETFENEEQARSHEHLLDDLATLMRDGPAVGISFVLTATQIGGVLSGVENAAELRLVLRQKDPSDYSLVGRFERAPSHVPPGRGFAAGPVPLELQIALPPSDDGAPDGTAGGAGGAGSQDGSQDGSEWGRFCARLAHASGGFRPAVIQDLPRWVTLDSLPRPEERAPGPGNGSALAHPAHLPLTLGLDDETFSPLRIDLAEAHHLVVAGPPRSGKSTLLATALLSSLDSAAGREARWYLATPRQSPLAELAGAPNCARLVRDLPELADLVTELENEVAERREAQADGDGAPSGAPQPRLPIFLVLDDYEILRQDDEDDSGMVETQLLNLAKRGRLAGLHVLLAGYNVELRRFNQQLAQHVAQTGAAAVLQPDLDNDGDLLGGVRLRRFSQGEPPPGRGYIAFRQRLRLFQAATPPAGPQQGDQQGP